jgi:hypothetical protein
MGVMFTPRMQTASRLADRGDHDSRKKVRADHLFERPESEDKRVSVDYFLRKNRTSNAKRNLFS